ncbi:bleomycin resistance protein [Qingshengfaniella alkalisoli]|uniref:Bleomycin resistance protein n=1 Tax=Qingshengfaniella alkalisoli TaxID=2599296 RepID=A0A5B8IYT0_9RHOB|nr:VOC family protein [Qingshengfaniella alkalisoli]QDY70061.1 VOC family protein [Qingshengfaniella alkalisoli]
MVNSGATNAIVPEFAIRDFGKSLTFYQEVLGFSVRYSRRDEGFAFLEFGSAALMIDQIGLGRTFQPELLDEFPLGRGLNLQITVGQIDPILDRLESRGVDLFLPVEERWYRFGTYETGQRQFMVADPDGYLLRFCEKLGERPVTGAS